MFGALEPGFRSLATIKLVTNVVGERIYTEKLRHRAVSSRQHGFLVDEKSMTNIRHRSCGLPTSAEQINNMTDYERCSLFEFVQFGLINKVCSIAQRIKLYLPLFLY